MNPPIERRPPHLPSAKAEANQKGAAFLDSLNDACTIETHLQEHQTRRDLLFVDTEAPHLTDDSPDLLAIIKHKGGAE